MTTKPRRALGIIVVVAALVALIGMALAWNQIRAGISAHDEPTAVEELLATKMRSLATPSEARARANPLEPTEEVLESGMEHWADHCATCHGNDGKGQTDIGRGLYPKAPDMTAERTQSLSDGELAYIIRNGIRLTGMPAWGEPGSGPSDEDWALVHFIRHLPEITPEELERMEGMNPISLDEMEEQRRMEAFLAGEDLGPEESDSAPHGEAGNHH